MKLINIDETNQFLTDLASENELSIAFIATPEGGIVCCNDLPKGRILVEALSTVWRTFPEPNWERISFEWESTTIFLENCGDYIFGLQQFDPNPLVIGLLRRKSELAAKHLKSVFTENTTSR